MSELHLDTSPTEHHQFGTQGEKSKEILLLCGTLFEADLSVLIAHMLGAGPTPSLRASGNQRLVVHRADDWSSRGRVAHRGILGFLDMGVTGSVC